VLPDRVAAAARTADPEALVADPLGPDPDVAQLILDRYRAALVHSGSPAGSPMPSRLVRALAGHQDHRLGRETPLEWRNRAQAAIMQLEPADAGQDRQ
jgi:hypothetical protein